MRVRKAKENGGGARFADYVWKPVVLMATKEAQSQPVGDLAIV